MPLFTGWQRTARNYRRKGRIHEQHVLITQVNKSSQHVWCEGWLFYGSSQGSPLQIQGPRGYKGGKGEGVRSGRELGKGPVPPSTSCYESALADAACEHGKICFDRFVFGFRELEDLRVLTEIKERRARMDLLGSRFWICLFFNIVAQIHKTKNISHLHLVI